MNRERVARARRFRRRTTHRTCHRDQKYPKSGASRARTYQNYINSKRNTASQWNPRRREQCQHLFLQTMSWTTTLLFQTASSQAVFNAGFEQEVSRKWPGSEQEVSRKADSGNKCVEWWTGGLKLGNALDMDIRIQSQCIEITAQVQTRESKTQNAFEIGRARVWARGTSLLSEAKAICQYKIAN